MWYCGLGFLGRIAALRDSVFDFKVTRWNNNCLGRSCLTGDYGGSTLCLQGLSRCRKQQRREYEKHTVCRSGVAGAL